MPKCELVIVKGIAQRIGQHVSGRQGVAVSATGVPS